MDIQGYLETVHLVPRRGSGDDAEASGVVAAKESKKEDEKNKSVAIVLLALCFMYSVHNLIAPNMTALAKTFHFNPWERDAYIGGELTLFFYFPGVLGSLFAGVLSGLLDRRLLLCVLSLLTSVACLLTARVGTFDELIWARAVTGFGIGGALPVVYSLVGDWFPARKRASATALVTAASGAGVFVGQVVATIAGVYDWRLPFFLIAFPAAITGLLIWYQAEEPVRGCMEEGIETMALYESTGATYVPAFGHRHLKALLNNKTNILVILQAFPGNIPWGVIIVYLHDFLVQDLGFSTRNALGAIATLAGAAFLGVLTGGFVGELCHDAGFKYLGLFGGACNMLRAVPFFLLFGWTRYFGPLDHSSEGAFFTLLMFGGFTATLASAITGAMLLNVNLPETRGSVVALYSILDDLSKGFGTLFVSLITRLVGGRAIAYQISLILWVVTGVAFLYTYYTYEEDEANMRKSLDEAARESMVLVSKQRAQQAVRDRAKAAGQAHFAQAHQSRTALRADTRPEQLRWPARQAQTGGWQRPTPNGSGFGATGTTPASTAGRVPHAVQAAASLAPTSSPAVRTAPPPPRVERDQLRKAVRAAAEAAASTRGGR